MKLSILSTLTITAQLASAHYEWIKFSVNGQMSKDFEYIRKNSNGYMPTLAGDINNNDFRCNQGSMASAANTKVYTVKPGDKLGFKLAYGATMKHPGPLQVYMSKAPNNNVKTYDGSGDWFKVYQMGLCSDISDGLKDTDWCTWDKDTIEFTLPAATPPGQYLVRAEHIGLHRGHTGNAEFYFECAQIEVTGNGAGTPGPLVKIPGVYKASDPNIAFNIYYPTPTAYTLPGPAVWNGSSGGTTPKPSTSRVVVSSTAPVTRPTTLATTVKPSVKPTTAQPSVKPTTVKSSVKPTSVKPTSVKPTSVKPTSVKPTSVKPTSAHPTVVAPTSVKSTTKPTSSIKPVSSAKPTTSTKPTYGGPGRPIHTHKPKPVHHHKPKPVHHHKPKPVHHHKPKPVHTQKPTACAGA